MANEQTDGEDRSVLSRPAPSPTATWGYGSGVDDVADVYLPDAAVGVPVVLVHGGFWRPEYDRVHLRPLASALAAAGHPALSLEYPRRPGDPDASVTGLRRALAHLRVEPPAGWPDARPVLLGHSAGGHLTLVLAGDAQPGFRAAVALAPVADLALAEALALDGDAVVAFLGGPASSRPDLDPARRQPTRPVSVIHGAVDSLVPIEVTRSYQSHAHGVDVHVLEGAGHFQPIDPRSSAFAELLSLLTAAGIE